MPPADTEEAVNLSASDEDDDFIPESLRAFVMEAENALGEHQQDFWDELAPSPTNANNTTADSADIDPSLLQLGGIQNEMEKVTIQDDEEAAAKKAAVASEKLLAKEAIEKAEEERLAREAALLKEEEENEAERLAIEATAQKAAEEERHAEVARQEAAEEERLAESARQKVVEEERLAEFARQKAAEEEKLVELARRKAAEEEKLAELARQKAADEEEIRLQKEEQDRLAREAVHLKAEEERQAREAALIKDEEGKLAREAAAAQKTEQSRLAREEARKQAAERLAKEAEAERHAEAERLAVEQESARKAKEEQLAKEAVAKGEQLAREAVLLKEEEDRMAREDEAIKKVAEEESDRLQAKEKESASPTGSGFSSLFGRLKQQVTGPASPETENNIRDDVMADVVDSETGISPQLKVAKAADEDFIDAMEGLEIMTDAVVVQKGSNLPPTQEAAAAVTSKITTSPKQSSPVPLHAPKNNSPAKRSQPRTPTSTASSNRSTNSSKKSTPLAPTSRLFKATSASKAHTPPSRLLKPITTSNAQTRTTVSPAVNSNGKRVPTRGSNISKPVPRSPTAGTGHFMQPTVTKRAHERKAPTESEPSQSAPPKKRSGLTRPQVSNRLMKGTAASSAPRRARDAKTSIEASLPQKRANDEAVNRARQRIRQRKLAEKTSLSGDSHVKFSVGTKSPSKPKSPREKPTGFGSKPILAHFAMATSSTVAHKRPPNVSVAQSGDIFGRGLRSEASPSSLASGNSKPGTKTLTIPKTPKFATNARSGKKELGNKEPMSLAQSTNLLASQLRGPTPALSGKRTTKLTRPQAPKFHTIHKRALPKSSAEMEAEEMAKVVNFRSHPYKANDGKALHTGSSTGLTKIRKRNLTKPAPFKLSGSGGTHTTTKKENGEENNDPGTQAGDRKKQFRARAMPKFSGGGTATKNSRARAAAVPQPFNFAVDMKSKSPSAASSHRSPRGFKARPAPKSLRKGPSIPVHHLSPSAEVVKQQVGPPPRSGPIKARAPTTPEPFNLESVQRHEAFQELLQEKAASEQEEFMKGLSPKALPLPETTYKPSISPGQGVKGA